MDRPDVKGIEKRLKELIAGPTYVEAMYLVGWIKQLETEKRQLTDGYGVIETRNEELTERIDWEVENNIKVEGELAEKRGMLTSSGNLIGEQRKELEELRAIGEEFIERRDKGEIRSTYTYNKLRKALGKDDSGDLKWKK